MATELVTRNRVLVVDDAPANVAVLVEVLRADHSVQVATSGEKCLEIALGGSPPDIILLDVMMPDMDGFEVCRMLKEDEDARDIPVIFVTALDDHVNEEMGFRLGAVDYIGKPIRPAVARERVRLHLALSQHRQFLEMLLARTTHDLALSNAELQALERLEQLNR